MDTQAVVGSNTEPCTQCPVSQNDNHLQNLRAGRLGAWTLMPPKPRAEQSMAPTRSPPVPNFLPFPSQPWQPLICSLSFGQCDKCSCRVCNLLGLVLLSRILGSFGHWPLPGVARCSAPRWGRQWLPDHPLGPREWGVVRAAPRVADKLRVGLRVSTRIAFSGISVQECNC